MRLVLFLLRCLVGLFAAIGFLVVAAVVAGALFWDRVEPLALRKEPVPEAVVLTLDLAPGLVERRPSSPLVRASLGAVPALRDVLDALEAAGADPRVRGLLVRVAFEPQGLAQVQELRDALLRFRAQGKFAVAFAESFGALGNGTLSYYLASACDRIWLQPSGDLGLTGFRLESPFLREALDEFGVTPRLDQRREFKGVANMLTDTALPAPQRRNLQRLVDSWLDQVVRGVAQARELRPEAVRGLVDRAPYAPEEARELGLVDRLGYWDEAQADALAAAGLDGAPDEDTWLSLSEYDARRAAPESTGPVVALVFGLGPIALGDSEDDPLFGRLSMGADTVAQALRAAVDDPEVEAIVLRIDSPGGSYVASDLIWREVQRAREREVPVVVSMGNVAASGGYFVAAPAHAIVAQPGTLTGSIGVVGGKLVLTDLWDRLGVRWDGVQAGDNADIWSLNRDFSAAAWAKVQAFLDRTYADFTGKVAEGRGLSPEQVEAVAGGRVWSGADALERGLVDALGGYAKALGLAREAAGIDPQAPLQVRVFPEERDPWEVLLEDVLAGRLESPGLRALARLVRLLGPLVEAAEATRLEPGPLLRSPPLRPAP